MPDPPNIGQKVPKITPQKSQIVNKIIHFREASGIKDKIFFQIF